MCCVPYLSNFVIFSPLWWNVFKISNLKVTYKIQNHVSKIIRKSVTFAKEVYQSRCYVCHKLSNGINFENQTPRVFLAPTWFGLESINLSPLLFAELCTVKSQTLSNCHRFSHQTCCIMNSWKIFNYITFWIPYVEGKWT